MSGGGAGSDSREVRALGFVCRHSGGGERRVIFCSASNPDVVSSPAEKNTDGGEETGEFENPVVKNTFFIMCSL